MGEFSACRRFPMLYLQSRGQGKRRADKRAGAVAPTEIWMHGE